MSNWVLFGIALSLAVDAFAVAVACSAGLRTMTGRHVFRLSFHFGLFQALMPLIGWLAGLSLVERVSGWDHWAAFCLLTFIGGKAVVASLSSGDGSDQPADPTRGLSLVSLSVATSLDALAVGLSFAFLHVRIWYASAVIGVVAAALTLVGMVFGRRLGALFGRRVEAVGGCALILIGLKILFDHLRG